MKTLLHMAVKGMVSTPLNENMNLNSNLDFYDALKLCKVIKLGKNVPNKWN
jgi:hypothetical protein